MGRPFIKDRKLTENQRSLGTEPALLHQDGIKIQPLTAKQDAEESVGTESQPTFQPFDPEGEVRVYCRHLPHWRQPGATYFVTFRQGDSIPPAVLAEWLGLRKRFYRANGLDLDWLKTDPDRFASTFQQIAPGVRRAFEREQAKLLHKELDLCHGSCLLQHEQPRQELVDALRFFHGSRMWLGDYVVMPNHAHATITPFKDWELEKLLASIKRWTARKIGEWLSSQPDLFKLEDPEHNGERLWQQESYDRIIRDREELTRYRRYIAGNPKKAILSSGQYSYESAAWLDGYAEL